VQTHAVGFGLKQRVVDKGDQCDAAVSSLQHVGDLMTQDCNPRRRLEIGCRWRKQNALPLGAAEDAEKIQARFTPHSHGREVTVKHALEPTSQFRRNGAIRKAAFEK
jgi:hypothetical protein